jgi:hypothetical protein
MEITILNPWRADKLQLYFPLLLILRSGQVTAWITRVATLRDTVWKTSAKEPQKFDQCISMVHICAAEVDFHTIRVGSYETQKFNRFVTLCRRCCIHGHPFGNSCRSCSVE